MLSLIIGFGILWIWLIKELVNAPKGYEDEAGFHFESDPETAQGKPHSIKNMFNPNIYQ